MFDLDKWKEILQTLIRNKSRSILTAFGIFWGIFMLVFLMGGSQGFEGMLNSNFDGFAQNSYLAVTRTTTKPYGGFQEGRYWELDTDDIRTLRRHLPQADVITPLVMQWSNTYKYQKQTYSGVLKGVYPNYAAIENPKISSGRYIQDADLRDYRKVCVLGKQTAAKLFPSGKDILGKFVSVNGVYYQVIGISALDNGMGIGGNTASAIYVPFTTLQRLNNRGRDFDLLALTAKPGHSVSALQPRVEELLKRNHRIAPDDTQAIMSMNMEAMFRMVQSLFEGVNILVWLIGVGTLISGSIGVSNIMMVVVKERTVEIGIRRAIGARPLDILVQVICESIVLTIVAGLSGIVFAVLLLSGVEAAVASSGFPHAVNFQISFWMAIGAAATLSLLGSVAGIAPALRALAVKPIDAIRDE